MLNDILKTLNFRRTKQSEQARGEQFPNAAGGWTFQADDAIRLRRFLILGVDGGTYYVSAPDLAMENSGVVLRLAEENPELLLSTIREVSLSGLAPRQNSTLFALAAAASRGAVEHRQRALALLPEIARTGTQLFLFAGYVEQFRGWGRSLRRAVANWYLTPAVGRVAYQAVKYRSRAGWSHRDLLRLAHPVTQDPTRRALFEWVVRGTPVEAGVAGLELIDGYEQAKVAPVAEVPDLVRRFGLTWEMLPDAAVADANVWRALVEERLPMTALMRQLPRLTRLGLLTPGDQLTDQVLAQLTDPEAVRAARVHPLQVLLAQRTYAAGRGKSTSWAPVGQVVDALDEMFYNAFQTVEPTGKRMLLALDVSSSMSFFTLAGSPVTPREASAAMAMVTARTESAYQILGFSHELVPLPVSPRQRLDDVVAAISRVRMGATDCALPMQYAIAKKLAVEAFVIYTDNETWYGNEHPFQALRRYRAESGIGAKLIVVGMTGTRSTIADPDDAGMLDVVGFDAGAPAVIADFIRF